MSPRILRKLKHILHDSIIIVGADDLIGHRFDLRLGIGDRHTPAGLTEAS
jgi:hypothetical protein